jgi:hypothetical protein
MQSKQKRTLTASQPSIARKSRRSISNLYRSGVALMKRFLRVCKILAIVLVVSLVIAHWPHLVFGTAKGIVWVARAITGAADSALAWSTGRSY